MNAAVEELAGLAGTYRLFARLWLREVDEPLLADLLRPPLCDVFSAAGGALPDNVDSSTLEELAVDYCQLFVGPANHLPPYQSVWQRGQFQSESADSMQRYEVAIGYETGGLMFDHLGVQLDVMGHLLDCGPESGQHSDEVFRLAATYFAEHLTWAAPLLKAASSRASTDFYRSTIRMTHDFLNSEQTFWAATRP